MTDTTAPTQAPAPAPASHETSATPTPVTSESVQSAEDAAFEQNLREFLGHDFSEPESAAQPQPAPVAQPSSETPVAPAAPAGVAPPVDPAGAPVSPSPVQANGGLTPPANAGHEGTSPQVDPNLLMAMMGQAQPTAPTPAAQPETPQAPAAQPTPPTPWEPFSPDFQLPPQLTEVLFRSEDPQQQGQALVSLLSSFGNAIAQTVEHRITTHHAPQLQSAFVQEATARQQSAAVHADFYGAHEDLKPYTAIVKRAGEVFFAQNPNATYSPEVRDKIATLARAAAAQFGYKVGQPAPAAPTAVAPGTQAPNLGYVAGAARPASLGMPEDTDSPGSIVDQLSAW